MNKRFILWGGLLLMLLACNMGGTASPPNSDLLATLAASTPLTGNPVTPMDVYQSPTPSLSDVTSTPAAVSVPTSSSTTPPTGKIVFTCQIFKVQASNQICIINADGSGFSRLTTDDTKQHYYPSLSPDGWNVVYAAFVDKNLFDIFEMNIASGSVKQVTKRLGILNAPEISPDGKSLVFKHSTGFNDKNQIWIMDLNGGSVENIPSAFGWDPTWSPDGKHVLFASDKDGAVQLFTIRINGKELHKISNLPAIRGRSDWSPNGQFIVTYSGETWKHEVYIMNADGSNARVLSPLGGNAQGPSFSPDGQWVAFTAYYDHPNDENGCEIYILRIDGTDLRRLTNNDYCDYQPRWGP